MKQEKEITELKKQIDDMWQKIDNLKSQIRDKDKIIFLFPKAGEDGLLSKEDFRKLHDDFFGKGSGSCCEIDDTDLCYHVAKAQKALDDKRWIDELSRFYQRSQGNDNQ